MKPFFFVGAFALVLALAAPVRAEPTDTQKAAVALAKLVLTPDSYKQMFDKMVESIQVNQPANAQNGPDFWKRFRAEIEKIMPYQELVDDQVGLMTKYYTADEVKQMIVFYQSPVGQKALHVMPEVMSDVMGNMQLRLQQRLPAMLDKLKAEEAASTPAPAAAKSK